MLKLRKVQILGFKSFCDRTDVPFAGEGIAAIVGPNGCGKSNISDAITWVLGEQSAKSLRGLKMEDVIFAGTRDRKATGMAEVSLTLVDPDVYDGQVRGSDGPELVISDREITTLPDDWSEEELRRENATATEEAVADAQPGVTLDPGSIGEAMVDPAASEAAPSTSELVPSEPVTAPATSDTVVLKVRRRRFQRAPVRAGEITVTRRLFRTGDSEYLLNGRICRLRDIQDIFMGTGLGGESYAMIGQERIGQLLSSKPLDRRSIIEEAAGITRFKTKKRLAELRLEASRQNLARVNDIFDEVTKQIGTLKRQAAKAERFSALRDEWRSQLRVVLSSRLAQLDGDQQVTTEQVGALSGEIEALAEELALRDAEHAGTVQHGYALDEQTRTADRISNESALELERIAARRSANTDRTEELARRIRDGAGELEAARAQQAALVGEADQHHAFLATATGEAAHAHDEARLHAGAAQEAVRATAAAEAQAETARRTAMQLMQRAGQIRAEQAQAEAVLAGLDRESERLSAESDVARTELSMLGVQRGQISLSFESVNERLRRLEGEIATLRLDGERNRQQEAEGRRRGDALRRELATVHGRRSSIEGLIRDHSYSTDTVKNVFRNARRQGAGGAFAPLGTLADLLEVEGEHGPAVDEFLRDELSFILVSDWDAAEAGVQLLKTDIAGRATFLVRDPKSPDAPARPSLAEEDRPTGEGLVSLMSCIRMPESLAATLPALLPRLRDGYIASDSATARDLALRFPQAWFVTSAGEIFHGYTVTGGRPTSGGPLALKHELRETEERSAALEAELATCDQATSRLARDIAEITSAAEARTAERRDAEREAANSGAALRQMESETARIERRLADWQTASERNRAQRTANLERIERRTQEAASTDAERETLEATLLNLQGTLDGLRRRREDLQQAASAAGAQLAALEERRRSAQSNAAQTARLLVEHTQRLAQLEQSIAAAAAERLRREEENETLATQHATLNDVHLAANADGVGLREHAATLRERRSALDHQLRLARTALEERRERRGELTVRAARLASDIEHLHGTCLGELGVEPATLRADSAVEHLTGDALSAAEEEIRTLKQRLESMGPVNMMALEEYSEASSRHQFLETQRNDLLVSMQNTEASIREIDDVSRVKFDEAFTAINQNFSVTFSKLFGGGQALMKLTDSENAAESGIDIIASPPGKKLQNLLLLSGGEKALTALSLLVGIFQFQPAPFCVLDEVDAPLDETNVGRFAQLIAEMSATTQFVVITHSKRTMQQADVIFGVTMQEPGVSKVVSVKLGDRRSNADSQRAVA